MPTSLTLEVRKDALDQSHIVSSELPPDSDLAGGQLLLATERLSLTANNVTYAVLGERMHYWRFFPASAEDWGVVPAWGHARVLVSKHPEVAVGERLYGYWPMASHALLQPGRVGRSSLSDASPHRAGLPQVYQEYRRLGSAQGEQHLEDLTALLHPLYATAWLLADFVADQAAFGARRILLTSASSKTALAAAIELAPLKARGIELVGLTSPGRVDFVTGSGLYDRVIAYPDIESLAADEATVLLDFAGDAALRARIHAHCGSGLRHSAAVGITHHEAGSLEDNPGGVRPQLFFAPAQYAKRRHEWGAEIDRKLGEGWQAFATRAGDWFEIRTAVGGEAIAAAWSEMLAGRTDARTGQMLAWS
jgi:hypothetical protein